MCDFIHYKYKPCKIDDITYNNDVKNFLKIISKKNIENIIFYGMSGSGKKTFMKCYLNEYFNNNNIIYNMESFNFTLSNNYKISYKSSSLHYQINFIDNYKNNILIIHELIYYLIQSKSINNDYIIIILYNIDKLEHNIKLLKIIMEKYHHVKFICSSKKRYNDLELAFQIRIENLSEFELLKIILIIKKKENINISNSEIIKMVKTSNNNLHILLNLLQSFINKQPNELYLLDDICNIIKKKNIKDFPEIKQILNKIFIFTSLETNYIIEYIYSNIIFLVKNKHEFINYIACITNTNNIIHNIIKMDTYIFYIYKMIK